MKFTYFNARGRGEFCRLLLSAGEAKWEDNRITQEEWPALKPKTPQGTLPMLEVDGQVLCQSLAIARFLARKNKMTGSNDMEEVKVNIVIDTITDLRESIIKCFFEKDEAKKEELMKKLKEETFPKTLSFLEKMIKDNGSGFIVGKSVTAADLIIYEALENSLKQNPDMLDKDFKGIKALREKVASLPKIKAYISKRPETAF